MIDMTPSLFLVLVIAVLVGCGVYLLLERTLTRIVIGASLLTHGINLLILLAGGRAGGPPILGQTDPADMSDPLPQAFVLTAIVISLATTAFILAVAYRSWQLNGHDEVQDDLEDRRIARMAAIDALLERATDDAGTSLEEDAEITRDETEDLPTPEPVVAVERLDVDEPEEGSTADASVHNSGFQQDEPPAEDPYEPLSDDEEVTE